jgi:hypothetical protein
MIRCAPSIKMNGVPCGSINRWQRVCYVGNPFKLAEADHSTGLPFTSRTGGCSISSGSTCGAQRSAAGHSGINHKGISLGCPPSPLMGAFFLNALDAAAANLRVFYIRFMDDILILAPTRWQLRGAVRLVNASLRALDLEKHPDKTFIGRIERGFDFLGYRFGPHGLAMAAKTVANFIDKASRLYEQERRTGIAVPALEMYVERWLRWVTGGLGAGHRKCRPFDARSAA